MSNPQEYLTFFSRWIKSSEGVGGVPLPTHYEEHHA